MITKSFSPITDSQFPPLPTPFYHLDVNKMDHIGEGSFQSDLTVVVYIVLYRAFKITRGIAEINHNKRGGGMVWW